MAILIPPKPQGNASPSVARMFQTLRRLPDTFIVWFSLHAGLPHFLVLWKDRHGFLIQVAATTQQLAESALQRTFFDDAQVITADDLGGGEKAVMDRFIASAGVSIAENLPLRKLVVFPNVDQSTIDQIELLRSSENETTFLGMRRTNDDTFIQRLEALATAPLAAPELIALRKEFTPESVIHDSCRPLPLALRQNDTTESPGFLDFAQESLVKLDIELSPDATRALENSNARLITGLAGSGKSLVLLHRAIQAARLHPESRLLVLTHNRPINGELRRRFSAMAPELRRVEWLTFFQWANRLLPPFAGETLGTPQISRRIESLRTKLPALARFTPSFLTEEVNYLRDLGITNLTEYLDLDRKGRLIPLQPDHRSAVWKLLESYRASLHQARQTDWQEIALAMQTLAKESPEKFQPGYDFIFIDEAQFFAKAWFPPVTAALRPGAQLFLSADPTQGFLKRRQSWLEAGIDVRGRSSRLEKPYRTTRRLMAFATTLFQLHHSGGHDEADDLADSASLSAIDETGEWPELIRVSSPSREIQAAVDRVRSTREKRPELAGRMILMHTDHRAATELIAAINHQLGPGTAHDAKILRPPAPNHFCTVSTLNAATGLEAAIVLVLGLDRLIDQENDPRLEPDALAELRADHAKMLYVASTRAARRLVIYAIGDKLATLLSSAREKAASMEKSPLT